MQVAAGPHGLRLTRGSAEEIVWEPCPQVAASGGAEREIRVPGVATFTVTDGHRVTIARDDGAEPVDVQASLDGRVTAALLQQRRTLPLHLAAVVLDGRAVGFAGPPGAGKSSLAAALADRGHPLLTDDLGAVTYDEDGRPALHPGPPMVRIWGSSARALGWPTDDRHRIKAGADKYVYEPPGGFAHRPMRLAAVYVLLAQPGDLVPIEPVEGFQKFETYLTRATYNREFLDNPASRAWHFAEVCRIADQVRTFTLRVAAEGVSLTELATEVERHSLRQERT
jgi:hypothetical protein